MALYAVHAYESLYDGLHGIKSLSVIEANSDKEAFEYANDEAWNVVYDFCYDRYEEMACGEDVDEIIKENLCYEVYKIKDTNESLELLDSKFYNDPDDFIEKYCQECI